MTKHGKNEAAKRRMRKTAVREASKRVAARARRRTGAPAPTVGGFGEESPGTLWQRWMRSLRIG